MEAYLRKRLQGNALFRASFKVIMSQVRQSPETALNFSDPALVLQQVQVVVDDRVVRIQALGDAGCVE